MPLTSPTEVFSALLVAPIDVSAVVVLDPTGEPNCPAAAIGAMPTLSSLSSWFLKLMTTCGYCLYAVCSVSKVCVVPNARLVAMTRSLFCGRTGS